MRKRYWCWAFFGVAFGSAMMLLLTLIVPFVAVDFYEHVWVWLCVMPPVDAVLFVAMSKVPLFMEENGGKLVERYMFRREEIDVANISNIVYPFMYDPNDSRSRSWLFALADGREVVLSDAFLDFSSFAGRWWDAHGRGPYDCLAGVESDYVGGFESFAFTTPYLRCGWFWLVVFLFAVFAFGLVAVWLLPGELKAFMLAAMAVAYVFVAARRFANFDVYAGVMVIRSGLTQATEHTVKLDGVAGIRLRKYTFYLRMKSGEEVEMLYALSESQRTEFAARLREVGIGCVVS